MDKSKCESCTERCPQAELAHEIAKGRYGATRDLAKCAPFWDILFDESGNQRITPEHLRDLLQAEKDGQLVVLPCKLHESIFYLEDGNWFEDIPYEVNLGERPGERKDSLLFTCEDGFNFYEDDIGKTVFLTPEEAEAGSDGAQKVPPATSGEDGAAQCFGQSLHAGIHLPLENHSGL